MSNEKVEKYCINCKFLKNMQTTVKSFKCGNQDSDTYNDYVDSRWSCKKFEPWEEIKPTANATANDCKDNKDNTPVKKISKSLKNKIIDTIEYYEERLDEEENERYKLITDHQKNIRWREGRIEIIKEIIDDLKHDLDGAI